MKISLKDIRSKSPCSHGWKRTLDNFETKKATAKKISLVELIDKVGIEDAYWALCCIDYENQLPFLIEIGKYFSNLDKDSEVNGAVILELLDLNLESDKLRNIVNKYPRCLYTLIATPTDNLYKISRFSVGILMQDGRTVQAAEKEFWLQAEKLYRQAFK